MMGLKYMATSFFTAKLPNTLPALEIAIIVSPKIFMFGSSKRFPTSVVDGRDCHRWKLKEQFAYKDDPTFFTNSFTFSSYVGKYFRQVEYLEAIY
jgi:hypothetical protein